MHPPAPQSPQYGKTTDAQSDIDVVEAQLDDVVRHLIADLFLGATVLQEQVSVIAVMPCSPLCPTTHAMLGMAVAHAFSCS